MEFLNIHQDLIIVQLLQYCHQLEQLKKSNLFLLLESMQNEVHRFAITFFQKVHTESLLSSRLDTIDGIGKKRKQILLEHFDSIEAIKKATIEELIEHFKN
jgi:excinuclease ABC subunit C